MKEKLIEAKCPYCGHVFKHKLGSQLQILWGQYSPEETNYTCESCGKESVVSIAQTYKYSAKKIKEKCQND